MKAHGFNTRLSMKLGSRHVYYYDHCGSWMFYEKNDRISNAAINFLINILFNLQISIK